MVKYLLIGVTLLMAMPASALHKETQEDLLVLLDALKLQNEEDPLWRNAVTPMLVATPKHLWVESRSDFAASVYQTLQTVFDQRGELISCNECDTHRLHVAKDQRLQIRNGELDLSDLDHLQQDPRYSAAKSVATIKETTSGVLMRIVSLQDGRIVFLKLADNSEDLLAAKPYLGLNRELRRRKIGKSLSYVFLNIGVLPNQLVQLEFLEQWGRYNQHISGLGISMLNPNFAIGGSYHWMWPRNRRIHVGGGVYYPLQNALTTVDQEGAATGGFVLQISGHYAIAKTIGILTAVSSEGQFTVGFSLYNPLLFPFLL